MPVTRKIGFANDSGGTMCRNTRLFTYNVLTGPPVAIIFSTARNLPAGACILWANINSTKQNILNI